MKVEEIIEELQVIKEGGLYIFDFDAAISALERLKPTVITDDPATWPPTGDVLIGFDSNCMSVVTVDEGSIMCRDGPYYHRNNEKDMYLLKGIRWSLLPDWGE